MVFQDALGGFEAPQKSEITNTGKRYAIWSVFSMIQIAVNIVSMNSLIAILGDSFEKVQLDKNYYEAHQKFGLLKELNQNYMLINRFRIVAPEYEFVHFVRYGGD